MTDSFCIPSMSFEHVAQPKHRRAMSSRYVSSPYGAVQSSHRVHNSAAGPADMQGRAVVLASHAASTSENAAYHRGIAAAQEAVAGDARRRANEAESRIGSAYSEHNAARHNANHAGVGLTDRQYDYTHVTRGYNVAAQTLTTAASAAQEANQYLTDRERAAQTYAAASQNLEATKHVVGHQASLLHQRAVNADGRAAQAGAAYEEAGAGARHANSAALAEKTRAGHALLSSGAAEQRRGQDYASAAAAAQAVQEALARERAAYNQLGHSSKQNNAHKVEAAHAQAAAQQAARMASDKAAAMGRAGINAASAAERAAAEHAAASSAYNRYGELDRDAKWALNAAGRATEEAAGARVTLRQSLAHEDAARAHYSHMHSSVERAGRAYSAAQTNYGRATSREVEAQQGLTSAVSRASAERADYLGEAARLRGTRAREGLAEAAEASAHAASHAASVEAARVGGGLPAHDSPLRVAHAASAHLSTSPVARREYGGSPVSRTFSSPAPSHLPSAVPKAYITGGPLGSPTYSGSVSPRLQSGYGGAPQHSAHSYSSSRYGGTTGTSPARGEYVSRVEYSEGRPSPHRDYVAGGRQTSPSATRLVYGEPSGDAYASQTSYSSGSPLGLHKDISDLTETSKSVRFM
ncbi:hypothetical protein DIPPA_30716 [Diplonema papillatum]|nr:hypothetical protein DIPPA_30716 [Diplonema papillatum]